MAIQGPIPVDFGTVFPLGVYAAGEFEPVRDFDRRQGDRFVQQADKATGAPLWVVEVIEADPQARARTVKVKVAAVQQPVLPPAPGGAPFVAVEFTGRAGDAGGARDQLAALLPIRERVLGPEHPSTLTTRGNLAYWTGEAVNTGDAAGARDRRMALTTRQRAGGPAPNCGGPLWLPSSRTWTPSARSPPTAGSARSMCPPRVIITDRDCVVPPGRQLELARAVPVTGPASRAALARPRAARGRLVGSAWPRQHAAHASLTPPARVTTRP